MKKNFFMLAATAALFAACAETELVNEVNIESNSQAIGFSTFANKVTRATTAENSTEIETQGLQEHHDDFVVWGYKNTVKEAYVFNAVKVAYSDGAWSYSPLKYWDKAANNYYFYAAAPYDTKWKLNVKESENQQDNYFTYDRYMLFNETHSSTEFQESFKTLTKNKDLMIASPKTVQEHEILTHDVVALEFNHILSRLNITIAKAATFDGVDVELVSISVSGLKNVGDFSELASADVNGINTRWSNRSGSYTITGNPVTDVTITTAETKKKYVLQSLVIPQDAAFEPVDRDGSSVKSMPYLYLSYKIGGELYRATYNLANAFGKTDEDECVAFNEGWQNTLNITLDADVIEFTAETFKWEEISETNTIFGNETNNTHS